jgi:hypothetical protein
MKGISLGSFRLMGLGRHWCAGALAGAILLSGSRAGAAPIRHEDLSSADATAFKEWSRYLLAGPSVWQEVLHPPVTPAVRSAIWESVRTDPGGADPMVHYLLWKQSLDPTRFAFYHPKLAPAHPGDAHRSSTADPAFGDVLERDALDDHERDADVPIDPIGTGPESPAGPRAEHPLARTGDGRMGNLEESPREIEPVSESGLPIKVSQRAREPERLRLGWRTTGGWGRAGAAGEAPR